MQHLGDITKLNGAEIPVVDVICGGSPCQDLSIAGLRNGLAGERSGLFMEQVRIVKEMRENDRLRGRSGHLVRPRFMVWENVDGARSSSGGKDFQAVLTEIARIAEPNAPDVPMPQKWGKAGCIYDELGRWSIAWRVHDAQFWGATYFADDGSIAKHGTPQRRRRISLVADFGGLAAPEVLFERKGLHRHPDESIAEGQGTAGGAEKSFGATIPRTLKIRSGCEGGGKGALIQEDKSATLSTLQDQTLFQPVGYGIGSYHSNAWKSDNPHSGVYEADTSKTLDSLSCGYPACNQGGVAVVAAVDCRNGTINEDVNGTLQAKDGGGTSLNCNNVVMA